MANSVFYFFLLIQCSFGNELNVIDDNNIQYTTTKQQQQYFKQQTFQAPPHEQRIYDRSLGLKFSTRSEFMSEPVFPDPLLMPYASALGRRPFNSQKVRFDPPSLDFSEVPLGQEIKRTVTIHNLDSQNSIEIDIITSGNPYFSCTLPRPTSETESSFDVIFIPRSIGNVEQTLLLKNSRDKNASLKYSLFGSGVESPYRIQPFLGARIPMNKSAIKLHKLSIYNPDSRKMQITEMYSSSSLLQIGFQNVQKDSNDDIISFPTDTLEVGPYEEKEFGFASYIGREMGYQSAFIRITFQPDCSSPKPPPEKNLIIPLEVEVSDVPGIYASTPLLDFGIFRQSEESSHLSLSIINSGKKARDVEINWIRQTPIKEPFLKIHYKSLVKLSPNEDEYTNIATLSFDYKLAAESGQTEFSGFIRVHVKNTGHIEKYQDLDVPWKAKILDGNLDIDPSETQFLLSKLTESKEYTRKVMVTNTLRDPLVLYKIEIGLEAENFFTISDLEEPLFVQPHQPSKLFTLTKCDPSEVGHTLCPEEDFDLESTITLYTNASTFIYPLVYYSGMIKYEVIWIDKNIQSAKDVLDYGLTSFGDEKCLMIAFYNHNNRNVKFHNYSIDLNHGEFDLWPMTSMTMDEKDLTTEEKLMSKYWSVSHKRRDQAGFPLTLERNSSVFLEACFLVDSYLYEVKTVLEIFTEFQKIKIPVVGKFNEGRLKVLDPPVVFEPSFPGKKVATELTVYSTFKSIYKISQILSQEPDMVKFESYDVEVKPMTRTKIGKLVFDAGAMCSVQCIGSLHDGTKDGKEWLMKLDKPNTAAKADSELYRAFRDNLNRPIKTENVLYTRLKTMYDFEIKTNVQWPRLARISSDGPFIHEPILFPPTVVNAKITGQRTLVIENPTEWSIIVQPILLGDMENKHKIENELKKDFNFLVDLKNGQKYSDDFGIGIKQKNGNPRPRWTLPPGKKETLHLGFLPKISGDHEAVLLLRNNLTVMEPIRLSGKGIVESLTLFNGNDIFIMSMRNEDLTECYHTKPGELPFRKGSTTKIKIQNFSSIGSKIRSIKINNETCAGNGWEVVDCKNGKLPESYIVPPSNSGDGLKIIKLKYKPDFSVLETNNKMVIETEYGAKFPFTLTVKIPEEHIEACRAAIPRPPWEAACRRIILIMMIVLLSGICLMGFIEASYIVEPWVADILTKKMDLKLSSTFAAQNLVKLYPEYLRRLQKQSQKSPGKSEIKRTIRQLSQSTDLIPQHSTKVNDNRITKSVETINTVVNHHEIEPVEEIPTWLDEPLDRPDKNFAKMARDAGELDKEIAELHNFKQLEKDWKDRERVKNGLRHNGRITPAESTNSSIPSSTFPISDSSENKMESNQSSSSFSSKGISDDESEHHLLPPTRNDIIRSVLFPTEADIFSIRKNLTPPSRDTPNSSSSGGADENTDAFGLNKLVHNFDRAPGPPPRFYPNYQSGYAPVYRSEEEYIYQRMSYERHFGAFTRANPLIRAHDYITPAAPVQPVYPPVIPPGFENQLRRLQSHDREPVRNVREPVRNVREPVRNVREPVRHERELVRNEPTSRREPVNEFVPGNVRGEHWPGNDRQFFQFMSEEQRRKLREDAEKKGSRYQIQKFWDQKE